MKVSELLETLSEKLGWKAATPAEGLLTGAPDTTIRGIAACGMPSVDVLRQAIAAGRNLILSRFFLHNPVSTIALGS